MHRIDQYLSVDTKTKFIGFDYENLGNNPPPPWLDVLQKIAWLDEG